MCGCVGMVGNIETHTHTHTHEKDLPQPDEIQSTNITPYWPQAFPKVFPPLDIYFFRCSFFPQGKKMPRLLAVEDIAGFNEGRK